MLPASGIEQNQITVPRSILGKMLTLSVNIKLTLIFRSCARFVREYANSFAIRDRPNISKLVN